MRNVLSSFKGSTRIDLRRMQSELLRGMLRKQLPFSAYYQDLFTREKIDPSSIQNVDDLERLPFTSKKDLLNSPENPKRSLDFLIKPDEAALARRPEIICKALTRGKSKLKEQLEYEYRPVFMTSTTGRSSEPVPFLYTNHDIEQLKVAGAALCEVFDTQPDTKVFNMFPYAPHLAFWQVHYAMTTYDVFGLSTGGGKVMGTQASLRLMSKVNPDTLVGMPTFLYHLLRTAVEEGLRIDSITQLVLGGEKVASGMRQRLRKLAAELGSEPVRVMATYGFTEAKMAFGECPGEADGGYHIPPHLAYIEIIDPKTGAVQPEGAPGEIVFTPLNARGTVVLRYRTGDTISGGLSYEPCPHCGLHVPRLIGRIGRESEVRELRIDKIKGTLVDFNTLEHLLDNEQRVGTWLIELRKKNDDPLEVDEVILHVYPVNGVDRTSFAELLSQKFQARTELRPNRIEFQSLDAIQKMQGLGSELKEKRLVDHRPAEES